jgi:hypothetical protein
VPVVVLPVVAVLVLVLSWLLVTGRLSSGPGGRTSTPGWVAAVTIDHGAAGRFHCSGAVVAPGWVLTAAHCVHDVAPGDLHVFVGRKTIPSHSAGYVVRSIRVMPGFALTQTPSRRSDRDDAALLGLAGWRVPRPAILPLASQPKVVSGAGPVTLFGYGITGFGRSGQPIGGDQLHASPTGAFTDRGFCGAMLCVDRAKPAMIAAGDSGGPWVRLVSGRPQLIGVQDTITGLKASGPAEAQATPMLGRPHTKSARRTNPPTLAQWIKTTIGAA